MRRVGLTRVASTRSSFSRCSVSIACDRYSDASGVLESAKSYITRTLQLGELPSRVE